MTGSITWPADFTGEQESNSHHEAIYKRLRTPEANPRLDIALRYAEPGFDYCAKIKREDFVGIYRRLPVENDYHEQTLTLEKDAPGKSIFRWKNKAGVTWQMIPEIKNVRFKLGLDTYTTRTSPRQSDSR